MACRNGRGAGRKREGLLLWMVYGDRVCGVLGLYLWPTLRDGGLVRDGVRGNRVCVRILAALRTVRNGSVGGMGPDCGNSKAMVRERGRAMAGI